MYFTKDGVLPRGDFELTINELRQSVLIKGENDLHVWDEQWRIYLIDQLEILVQELWKDEVDQIIIDGSYVENKAHPTDIDAYYECDVLQFGHVITNLYNLIVDLPKNNF